MLFPQADSANALQLMKNFGRDKNSDTSRVRELQQLSESTAARAEGLYVMIGSVMGELAELKKDGTAIRAMAAGIESAVDNMKRLQDTMGDTGDFSTLVESISRQSKAEVSKLSQDLATDVKKLRVSSCTPVLPVLFVTGMLWFGTPHRLPSTRTTRPSECTLLMTTRRQRSSAWNSSTRTPSAR